MSTGLRERRKQETRLRISDVATQLFTERGFDEVTISQVAEAAGVSKMTVTNYFARKEDLVFDRAEGLIAHLAEVITGRKPGESMLAAVRRDYAEAIARADVTLGLSTPEFARMITSSPALIDRGLEMMAQRETALAEAIMADTGRNAEGTEGTEGTEGAEGAGVQGAEGARAEGALQPRLVAALLAAAHRVLAQEATRRSLAGEPRPQICAALADLSGQAFDLLEPSIGSYGIRA